jgi:hypothetical protein
MTKTKGINSYSLGFMQALSLALVIICSQTQKKIVAQSEMSLT